MRPLIYRSHHIMAKRTLKTPYSNCTVAHQPRVKSRRCQHTTTTTSSSSSNKLSSLPRFLQPSIWRSIIPTFLRSSTRPTSDQKKKPPNPASYFIWIYLFIGSQAIRIITIQNDHRTFMRRAELKISLLRGVVEKLQRGEDVDVEKALGTGDETQEREWEAALREIEEEEHVWQLNKKKKREERRRLEEEARQLEVEREDASPVMKDEDPVDRTNDAEGQTGAAPGFY